MKNNQYIALTMLAATLVSGMGFTACQQDAVSDLEHLYTKPQSIKIVSASDLVMASAPSSSTSSRTKVTTSP